MTIKTSLRVTGGRELRRNLRRTSRRTPRLLLDNVGRRTVARLRREGPVVTGRMRRRWSWKRIPGRRARVGIYGVGYALDTIFRAAHLGARTAPALVGAVVRREFRQSVRDTARQLRKELRVRR